MSESFVFKDPLWFAALIVIAGVVVLRLFRRQPVLVVPFAVRWQAATRGRVLDTAAVGAALVGLAFLVGALARPQTLTEHTEFGVEAHDVMLAIDVSRSMLSEDYEMDGRAVNRLDALKPIVASFVLGRPRDRIGIVVFSGNAYTLMAPTWNHARVLWAFEHLDVARFPGGTAIGDGVALALHDLAVAPPVASSGGSRPGFVVLMSDGSNNAGLFSVDEAVRLARERGTRIYSIAAGTGEYSAVPYFDEAGEKHYEIERADVDEGKLWTIAHDTGAEFFRATNAAAIHAAFETIAQRQSPAVPRRTFLVSQELFLWFAVPGLACVVLAAGLFRVSPARLERGARSAGAALRTAHHAVFYEMRLRLVP